MSIVAVGRHEKSLEWTQARGEGELHAQDAYVAEVNYGETVMVEPEYPCLNEGTTRRRAMRGNARLTRPINR